MSAYEFNLSRYAERLEAAGVPREQALVHAELTADTLQQLVTKEHLHSELLALEARMETRTGSRFEVFEARLEARFAAFEARIETRLAKMQADLFRWLFIAVFVQGGFILACLKLLA
ncbi:hypothetical protein ASC94_05505 [Massilia sp. Root418]|uniref:hypothetical protein n=1 Tax=Massilia sp. Root418 TaxID=1736532 RepID=UPI0006F28677|nr:hypothetical protein [Massilia sp. Root418]KQX02023.1 hypothetical protein ASC94_05505 [Massilia sp. Root418]